MHWSDLVNSQYNKVVKGFRKQKWPKSIHIKGQAAAGLLLPMSPTKPVRQTKPNQTKAIQIQIQNREPRRSQPSPHMYAQWAVN